ncbi:MAG: hypothetical protein JNK53_00940 [Phycisphaerae bacterium]|nr:hypothetical protein [Phycisphaerae bacterium]
MTPTTTPIVAAQGLCCDFAKVKPAQRDQALEEACDYRGDVTLSLVDGTEILGYLYDRRRPADGADGSIRIMIADTGEKRAIAYGAIARLTFSGKDTAAGKTFENWVKRYVEKRLAGERASIESETLD